MTKIADIERRAYLSAGIAAALVIVLSTMLASCGATLPTHDKQIEAASPGVVFVKKKVDDHFWTSRETPVLEDFPALVDAPIDEVSKYGGWKAKQFDATGFFHTLKQDGVWWLVDPEGYAFFSVGLNSVEPGVEATSDEAKLSDRFFGTYSSIEDWADQAEVWLGAQGFNTLGSWSDWRALNDGKRQQVPYTEQLHLLSHYAGRDKRSRLGEDFEYHWPQYHVFDPEFAEYCARRMTEIAVRTKDDPYLLGYFTDNELGLRANQLERFMALDVDDPVRIKVVAWLKDNGAAIAPDGSVVVTHEHRLAFYKYVAETYYSTVAKAVRDADPNHMILGDRFNYDQQDTRALWEIAGRYVDVFSYNWYVVWDPNENNDIENWARWSDRPVMITEWYAKGLDTGMENDTGAGWIVADQETRGKFYQTFALGLLDNPNVVGFHWFRYRDNNVDAAHLVDWSNRDSNKGFLDVDHQAYAALEDRARVINTRVYAIRDRLIGATRSYIAQREEK